MSKNFGAFCYVSILEIIDPYYIPRKGSFEASFEKAKIVFFILSSLKSSFAYFSNSG
jgi:hypothetical protein